MIHALEAFLLGVLACSSIIAGVFFLRFWKETKDSFFLAFAASFLIEGLNRAATLRFDQPNEANPWVYGIRFFAVLLILLAILRKNYGQSS